MYRFNDLNLFECSLSCQILTFVYDIVEALKRQAFLFYESALAL